MTKLNPNLPNASTLSFSQIQPSSLFPLSQKALLGLGSCHLQASTKLFPTPCKYCC